MTRYRVFEPESAELLVPKISTDDTIDLRSNGEYFTADAGDAILAPSVRHGDVLYIKVKSAGRSSTSSAIEAPPSADTREFSNVPESPIAPVQEPVAEQLGSSRQSRHFVATGFLGLDGDLEEEVPEPPKPWWKRLID